LAEVDQMSGRPIYAGRPVAGVKARVSALSMGRYKRVHQPETIRDHLRRIDVGLERDPPAAIASSNELVETTCKVILDDYGVAYSDRDDVMDLYKQVAKALSCGRKISRRAGAGATHPSRRSDRSFPSCSR
jgi:hypothetical protein